MKYYYKIKIYEVQEIDILTKFSEKKSMLESTYCKTLGL